MSIRSFSLFLLYLCLSTDNYIHSRLQDILVEVYQMKFFTIIRFEFTYTLNTLAGKGFKLQF